ncbi:MAG: hypothetical protein ACI8P3_003684 [Saprospiraceae bacterium]|jgi:hypothetical protein
MRYLILLFIISSLTFSCTNEQIDTPVEGKKVVEEIKAGDRIRDIIRNPVSKDQEMDTTNLAKIVFEEKRFDFGTVNEGDIVKHEYKFTNEGKAPLLIGNAKSTCGCTIPEWPKEPIPPGGEGVIKVRFDTKNKTDRQGKPIKITANTYPSETNLQLKGFVIPKNK